ncbi:MAG: hypothetical protein ACP5QA_12400 [Phycisphaerae bacterium]
MNKDVLVLRPYNKAEAFAIIEPFDFAYYGCHSHNPRRNHSPCIKAKQQATKTKLITQTATNPIWICAKATNYVVLSAICQEIEDIKKLEPPNSSVGGRFDRTGVKFQGYGVILMRQLN